MCFVIKFGSCLMSAPVLSAGGAQDAVGIFPSGPPANLRTYSTLHPTTGNLNLRASTPKVRHPEGLALFLSLCLTLYFSCLSLPHCLGLSLTLFR